MTVTDPVADMLTRIRNATLVKQEVVVVPSSRLKRSIAQVLVDEGYVDHVEEISDGFPVLRIHLKYAGGKAREPVLRGLERVSKPGRRVYVKKDAIPWVLSGAGTAIISTSQGIMSDREARRRAVGGEVLCRVW